MFVLFFCGSVNKSISLSFQILSLSVGVFSVAGGGRAPDSVVYDVIISNFQVPSQYGDEATAAAFALKLQRDEAVAAKRRPLIWAMVADKEATVVFSRIPPSRLDGSA